MKNKLIFSFVFVFALFSLMQFSSALTYTTQEDANETYSSNTNQYLGSNYTIPSNLISATWRVKYSYLNPTHTTLITNDTNLTIPNSCIYTDKLILRYYYTENEIGQLDYAFQCYNSTDYENVLSGNWNAGGGHSTSHGFQFVSNPLLVGNFEGTPLVWNIYSNGAGKYWTTSVYNYGAGNLGYFGLFDESITWTQLSPVVITINSPNAIEYTNSVTSLDYSISGDYVNCWFDDGNSINSVTCGDTITTSSQEGSNTWNIIAQDLTGNNITMGVTFNVATFKSGNLYKSMDESGAGLGIFMQMMAKSLPVLFIGLAIVGIIVAVALGIGNTIKGYLNASK